MTLWGIVADDGKEHSPFPEDPGYQTPREDIKGIMQGYSWYEKRVYKDNKKDDRV